MKITKRNSVVAVATVAATLAAGSIAYAFWTANGTGSAAAKAATIVPVNTAVVATVTSTSLLYPGATGANAVPAVVNVHNPNSVPVKVTGVSVASAAAPSRIVGGTDNAACVAGPATSLTTGTALTGLTTVIEPGADATFTVGTIAMATTTADGCQSATFYFDTATVTAQGGR